MVLASTVVLAAAAMNSPAAAAGTVASPIDCATAVIGGGWAGVYAAWRLVIDEPTVQPADLCLFEARAAVGGRTYSTEIDGMVLDMGAYRFGKQQHLPGDLIINHFQLPIQCYQPDCAPDPDFNETLYRIVDAHNNSAGYATAIRHMLAELTAAGVRVHYGHELTGIYDLPAAAAGAAAAAPRSALHFAGGQLASASAVLLNLPRNAIKRLDPASVVFGSDRAAPPFQLLRNCTPCGGKDASLAVKVYAIYDDPWWITKLGIVEGHFTHVSDTTPLVGRYHDGPVTRDPTTGDPIGPAALEAVYSYTFMTPQIAYYVPFATSPGSEPLTVTTDDALLTPLHAALMDYHAAAFAAKGLNASDVPPMAKVALGVWTSDQFATLTNPASSNMHWMIARIGGSGCPKETCLPPTPSAYNAIISSPTSRNIHLANNDYAWTGDHDVPCCWAEQSLKSVERTLHKAWGLAKPAWLDADYYASLIQF